MIMRSLMLAFFTLSGIFSTAMAQNHPANQLILQQDPRLDQIIAARIEFNKKLAASDQGFRILLYSGNQRQDAYATQSKLKATFADIATYLSFSFPNFKVMAGDFKTREEAQRIINDLQKTFSGSNLLIIPQKIDLTKYRELDTQ